MKTVISAWLPVLFVILIGGALFKWQAPTQASQDTSKQLFTPAQASQSLLGTNDPGVIRFRAVNPDIAVLEGAKASLDRNPTQEVSALLDLFADVQLEVVFQRVERGLGADVYVGRIRDVEGSFVHLAVVQGQVTGSINVSGKFYAVRSAGNGLHLVQEIDQSQLPGCVDAAPAIPSAQQPAVILDDGSLIDVMVLYTPAARNGAGGTTAMQSLINLGISETNTAYANSQVIQRLRLVQAAEVSYTESGNIDLDLNRLSNTSDGFMDGIHALRDTHRADLVTLIIDFASANVCGSGYLMAGNNPGFASRAFNIVVRGCVSPNYSFGHELGHNQGLNHARQDPIGTGAFSYSFGYKNPDNLFRDVMSYQCPSGL